MNDVWNKLKYLQQVEWGKMIKSKEMALKLWAHCVYYFRQQF